MPYSEKNGFTLQLSEQLDVVLSCVLQEDKLIMPIVKMIKMFLIFMIMRCLYKLQRYEIFYVINTKFFTSFRPKPIGGVIKSHEKNQNFLALYCFY